MATCNPNLVAACQLYIHLAKLPKSSTMVERRVGFDADIGLIEIHIHGDLSHARRHSGVDGFDIEDDGLSGAFVITIGPEWVFPVVLARYLSHLAGTRINEVDVVCHLIHNDYRTYPPMRLTLFAGEYNHVVVTNRGNLYTEGVFIVVRVAVEIMRYQLLRVLHFDRDDGPDKITKTTCMGSGGKLEVNTFMFLIDFCDTFLDSVLEKYLF